MVDLRVVRSKKVGRRSIFGTFLNSNPVLQRWFSRSSIFASHFKMIHFESSVQVLISYHVDLQEWYRRDAHESEDGGSPSSSILSQLLPPSLVCFLSNHDPADFSGVFR